jgi:antitoxin ParD1/3/4
MEMTIKLPDSLKDFVEAEMAAGGFASADEYFQALVRHVQSSKARQKVESLLEEGLSSESTEWTSKDLEDVKNEIRCRGVSSR